MSKSGRRKKNEPKLKEPLPGQQKTAIEEIDEVLIEKIEQDQIDVGEQKVDDSIDKVEHDHEKHPHTHTHGHNHEIMYSHYHQIY